MIELLIFGVVNILASALSGAAGGGGGLINTPFLVLLGLPPSTAIATAKFGGFGISAGSSTRFYKEKLTDRKTIIIFSIIGSGSAVIGSLLLVNFSEYQDALEKIMGLAILLAGIPLLYAKNMGLTNRIKSRKAKIVGSLLLGICLVFQAAIGAGIGMLVLIVLIGFFGMSAITASATRRTIQLVVATISLVIFIFAGLVDYQFGAVALITSFIGGFIGTHIAVKKGNKFIVNLFAIVSAVLAIQLLL